MNNNDIDSIIEELKNDSVPASKEITPRIDELKEKVNDDSVNDFVYKKTAELVEASLGAVQTIRDSVLTGVDPKEISALSQLINATSKALDTLNQINLQNKKDKNSVEVKKLELAAKDSIISKIPQTTNVLIATRDEIMSQMFDTKLSKKPTSVDMIEGDFERIE